MNQLVSNINKPFDGSPRILLWYSGRFPSLFISVHSFQLPKMLWPNAKFSVRCSANNIRTLHWVRKYLGNDVEIISDTTSAKNFNFSSFDVIYNHDYWFRKTISDKAKEDIEYIIYNVNKPFYCLYCDIILPQIRMTQLKKDMSNLTVLFNQNIIRDWGNERFDYDSFEGCEKLPNIAYVNMKLYYQLPERYYYKDSYGKKGCYFAYFHAERRKFFKKVLNDFSIPMLKLTLAGRNVEKLAGTKYYRIDAISQFEQSSVLTMLSQYDWALYIGRNKDVPYLGMTFYLPFVAGIPVFCYSQCEEAQKIFGGLNCFFSTEKELHELLENINLKELFKQQVERLKKYYND